MAALIETDFKPAWWLPSPHLQTLWPALFRSPLNPPMIRERLTTPDYDFIELDWCGMAPQPLVILLHGLTGSSHSGYIKGMQQALLKQGWRSVVMNFRGCREPNNRARCYHSGDTDDLHHLYLELKQREPDTPLSAVGYSLGGNVLLKWLGEQGKAVSLFAAAAVSVPFLLHVCANRMDRGLSQLYRNHLLRDLKQYIQRKRNHLEQRGLVLVEGCAVTTAVRATGLVALQRLLKVSASVCAFLQQQSQNKGGTKQNRR